MSNIRLDSERLEAVFCELCELGEMLDNEYKTLWLRERELVKLLQQESDNYEDLQLELEIIWQKMTQNQEQFD